MLKIRNYKPCDYEVVKSLYMQGDLYGGQFDEARDSQEKLTAVTTFDPQSILVCEVEDKVVGTVSLIDNGRVAWLFRFAVENNENEDIITQELYKTACSILYERGHDQILIYAPDAHQKLNERYTKLGMNKGQNYTCYWVENCTTSE